MYYLPNTTNTYAITSAPVPKTVTEVQHFLGLCAYYLRFFKDFTELAEPLRRLTSSGTLFAWDTEQKAAFEEIKKRISSAPLMAIFNESCSIFVSTDASEIGIGAMLTEV